MTKTTSNNNERSNFNGPFIVLKDDSSDMNQNETMCFNTFETKSLFF